MLGGIGPPRPTSSVRGRSGVLGTQRRGAKRCGTRLSSRNKTPCVVYLEELWLQPTAEWASGYRTRKKAKSNDGRERGGRLEARANPEKDMACELEYLVHDTSFIQL